MDAYIYYVYTSYCTKYNLNQIFVTRIDKSYGEDTISKTEIVLKIGCEDLKSRGNFFIVTKRRSLSCCGDF